MVVVTGATGHTGKVVAEALLAKGEKIRVIGRDAGRLQPFVQNGAEAVVGSADNPASIEKAFEGATAAFLMIPPTMEKPSFRVFQDQVSDAYAAVITKARVPYVVTLSSIGADQSEKVGPVVGLHNLEQKMNGIAGLNALHLRPAGFMENLFMSIEPMKSMHMLPGPLKGEVAYPMIAAKDIGNYAAERLHARDFTGNGVQELHGERDISMKEVATIVGNAIGKPKLSYMHDARTRHGAKRNVQGYRRTAGRNVEIHEFRRDEAARTAQREKHDSYFHRAIRHRSFRARLFGDGCESLSRPDTRRAKPFIITQHR
jgi:uncharacterized protein YbjT (DUF2867 family)